MVHYISNDKTDQNSSFEQLLNAEEKIASSTSTEVQEVNDSTQPTPKKKRPKFVRKVSCQVCGDVANDHEHFGGIACYACKAFFRRHAASHKFEHCKVLGICKIDVKSRTQCKPCRMKKCLSIGMKPEFVMTDKDKLEKKFLSTLKTNPLGDGLPIPISDYQLKMR